MFDENCTVTEVVDLVPTDMRLNKAYIIGYVNWTWTGVTVIFPFCLLVFLNIRIFKGLSKVKKNLNRHKRLEARAVGVSQTNKPEVTSTRCIQVKVTNENGAVGKLMDLGGGAKICLCLLPKKQWFWRRDDASDVRGILSICSQKAILSRISEAIPMDVLQLAERATPNGDHFQREPNEEDSEDEVHFADEELPKVNNGGSLAAPSSTNDSSGYSFFPQIEIVQ